MSYEKDKAQNVLDPYEAEEAFEWLRPVSCSINEEKIIVEYDPLMGVRPLEDPDFFLSFARLEARGEPSEAKIKNWVLRYGLPSQKREDKPNFALKEAAMSVKSFTREVRRARELLLLYAEIAMHNVAAIKARAASPGTWIDKELRKEFRSLDYRTFMKTVERGVMDEGEPELYLSLRFLVESAVSPYVEEVTLRPLVDGWYSVALSYKCPYMLSALYLQFLLMIRSGTPMWYCEHPKCRTPFPVKPAHRRFCNATCRSGARRYP